MGASHKLIFNYKRVIFRAITRSSRGRERQPYDMGIFSRCQITLEFDSTANFKFKTALKKKIIDNDGIVSFIVTKKVLTLYRCIFTCIHTLNTVCIKCYAFSDRYNAWALIIAHHN